MENKDITKKRLLFLCTGNSARSQIAEGLLRALGGAEYEVFSAGTKPAGVNFLAVKQMAEEGIDISKQYSKSVEEYKDKQFDYVITLCDNAKDTCPVFSGNYKSIHWSIKDPAAVKGTTKEKRDAFYEAVGHIRQKIVIFLKEEK